MKIALLGAEGTGRKTIAKRMERCLTYRPKMNISNISLQQYMAMPEDLRWRTLKDLFDEKLEQDSLFEHGIFDETLLDFVVLSFLHCSAKIDTSIAKTMLILTQESLQTFDLIFYFPLLPWFMSKTDPKFSYRVTYDMIIQGILKQIDIRPIQMPDIGIEERIQLIKKHLEIAEIVGGAPAKEASGLALVP